MPVQRPRRAARLRCGAPVLAALALGACGADDAPEPVTTVRVQGPPAVEAAYREVARGFERAVPGARVRVVRVGDRRAQVARLAAGDRADVVLLDHRDLGTVAERTRLVAPEVDEARFFPVGLDAFRLRGTLRCVPQDVSSLVLVVATDALRAAGIARPLRAWSLDELVAVARRARGDRPYGLVLEPSAEALTSVVRSAGGEAVDDPDAPTRLALGTPRARAGLRAFAALGAQGLVPRGRAAAEPAVRRFARGEAPLLLASRRDVPTLRAVPDLRFDVAPLPVLERPAAVLESEGLCVVQGPRTREAAAFVRYALGPAGQRVLAATGRVVPSLKAVARSQAFLGGARPATPRVWLDAIAGMGRLPSTAGWPRAEAELDRAATDLLAGEASAEQVAARLSRLALDPPR